MIKVSFFPTHGAIVQRVSNLSEVQRNKMIATERNLFRNFLISEFNPAFNKLFGSISTTNLSPFSNRSIYEKIH
jgi:hypothetical protein